MATYLITHRAPEGYTPSAESMGAWNAWFAALAENLVDRGNPVFNRASIGNCGSGSVLGGYTLIAAGRDPHPLDVSALRHLLAPPHTERPGHGGLGEAPDRLGAWLAGQPEGNRNRALFWAACRAAEAGIAEVDARATLGPAAARTGLDEREISATLASAYRTTARSPTANTAPPPRLDRSGP